MLLIDTHVIWDFSSSGSYYKGGPSDSGDHMETVDFSFTVPSAPVPEPTTENPVPEPPEPLEATCNMTLTVDDWGKMSVGEQTIDMTSGGEGPQGGHAKWSKESGEFTLKPANIPACGTEQHRLRSQGKKPFHLRLRF